jgi:hypothetical protein
VRLEWRERNGPRVAPPTREGFGTRLLERVLTTQAQAAVKVAYDPEGLTFPGRHPAAPEPGGRPADSILGPPLRPCAGAPALSGPVTPM